MLYWLALNELNSYSGNMGPEEIKQARKKLELSQKAFADLLGVSFATVNRWERGHVAPHSGRIARIRELVEKQAATRKMPEPELQWEDRPVAIDFEGDAERLKLVVDAHRLRNGHIRNKSFALELSRVAPLPHQRIAVYEHMLPQTQLRFILADDAGAGKTIMTGLYLREMLNRGRIRRALVVAPAGLLTNWQRELMQLFDLSAMILNRTRIEQGALESANEAIFILSVDTGATPEVRDKLASEQFDLVVFDECHKLSWPDPKRPKTRRYILGEVLAARCTHLLLLTATPHMGKAQPYYALWRLLDSNLFPTGTAVSALPSEKRRFHFIRRLKEEMIDYAGQPIYKPRLCQTVRFQLTPGEQQFYEQVSDYLRWSYENNRTLNQNAAGMVLAVLQRRLASSTYAVLLSLKRRKEKLLNPGVVTSSEQEIEELLDRTTADELEQREDGVESEEAIEQAALALARPQGVTLEQEIEYLDRLIAQGEKVRASGQEAKFSRVREVIESPEYRHEKMLIFTEHRDTLVYLQQRLAQLGYGEEIAIIHGGMDQQERDLQCFRFMTPEFRRARNLPHSDSRSVRLMLATDAAGEGLNLQFAWVMVNFDIPWNPARLEQRMGRLHRFGQRAPEVRIFNLVAENTREGDVLFTLLEKLNEARRELCSDKVFDVVGQQLEGASIRDLLRESLITNSVAPAVRVLEHQLATDKLRATIEEQRTRASSFGDVAQRLGALNSEQRVEELRHLLPAYVQRFVEHAAPAVGLTLDGDLSTVARATWESSGFTRNIVHHSHRTPPGFLTVRRDPSEDGAIPHDEIVFLRPGEPIFDALGDEVLRRFSSDAQRGGVLCDPTVERPYLAGVYAAQLEETGLSGPSGVKFERHVFGLKLFLDGTSEPFEFNHLIALPAAPKSLFSSAGEFLTRRPEWVDRLDKHGRATAETTILQPIRAELRTEAELRAQDLLRGFDYRAAQLAADRSEAARKVREGDTKAVARLEKIRSEQVGISEEKAQVLLFEQRRADLIDLVSFERVALALVIPDVRPEARQFYDLDVERLAVRLALNYEQDRCRARVFDVSSPSLARGYDLESHRPGGEVVAIEVKGRSGRGPVTLTDNEWPTAANLRKRYWLYVVLDCATQPRLYRVQDPIRLAFSTRQSFVLSTGDIIKEAEYD
jgi:superfamily II DNA or RNA helicase/DNA-binding XRE family transcriptional regulator